jgi:hypothetical protein
LLVLPALYRLVHARWRGREKREPIGIAPAE